MECAWLATALDQAFEGKEFSYRNGLPSPLCFLEGVAGGVDQAVEFGFDFFQRGFVHAVDEEDAVEVVVLVLDGAGEEAAAAETDCFALAVQRGDVDRFGAPNLGVDFGKAEAAFSAIDGFVDGGPLGIDQDQRHDRDGIGGLAVEFESRRAIDGIADVDDGELERFADLLGGEANTPSRRTSCRACR